MQKFDYGASQFLPPDFDFSQIDVMEVDYAAMDQYFAIAQLITGQTGNGVDFYAYMAMYPSRYREYLERVQNFEPLIIENYGRVLHKGWGTLPSASIQREMFEKYGIDHRFFPQLMREIGDQMHASGGNA